MIEGLFIYWILLTFFIVAVSAFVAKRYGYHVLVGLFSASLVIVNVLNAKMVSVGEYVIPAGTVLFGSMFLMTDMLSEFFGKVQAKKAIWGGFVANLMFLVSLSVVLAFPEAQGFGNGSAFEQILGTTPRVILASLIAYLIGQFHDVWSYHFWKEKTKGRHLWLRNTFSTGSSQLIDSIIFVTIAFYGVIPLFPVITSVFLVKLLIAVLDTPLIYLVRWYYRR